MITYDLSSVEGPMYKAIYELVKKDICDGKIAPLEKLPSKRALAKNLGLSVITVENAYDQLIAEGYVYAETKRGYYVSELTGISKVKTPTPARLNITKPKKNENIVFDFSSNKTESENFPFSIWAKLMRETISRRESELLVSSPCEGVYELRSAIANHLSSFRGMAVDPDQIIIGAGTEYLYSLIIKLLGNDKIYCIEDPGYKKLKLIYESNGAVCRYAAMDSQGILVEELNRAGADIAHISATHHFPTGITMPVSRRYELLAWANECDGRYIVEDDYDSEFRLNGKPIPPLQSIDACGKVIYMNTFSKSLTSTIRISYMVLPERLANLFYEKLSFYSCTVSTFEQYTLAAFIGEGYFEKHINRMRLHYGRKRAKILEIIRAGFSEDELTIIENDSGLHFLLKFNTTISDGDIKRRLAARGIKIVPVTDYSMGEHIEDKHQFVLNYSNMQPEELENAINIIKGGWREL